MNVVILLSVAAAGFAALWLAQTALLVAVREPWQKWPLRHRSEKGLVRWGMKLAIQGVLLALLFGYPAVIGENPIEYHRARLHPANWWLFGGILASAVLAMCPMFVLNVLVGWVKISPHYDTAKSVKKVIRCLLTPVPLAFVEEALFRGVVFIQVSRPFVEYKGPPWLVGYSSYPICGVLGVTSMALYVTALAAWLAGGVA